MSGSGVTLTFGPDPTALASIAIRRGLHAAGELLLAASDALAPREPEARHGVHMVETGYVKNNISTEGLDEVIIGYTAFWAMWQHEDMEYHHPNGGVAKFLELAVVEGQGEAMAIVADALRDALAAV